MNIVVRGPIKRLHKHVKSYVAPEGHPEAGWSVLTFTPAGNIDWSVDVNYAKALTYICENIEQMLLNSVEYSVQEHNIPCI